MRINFDKEKCLKLMKESEKLRQERRSFWDYEKGKSNELTRYLTLLYDHIFWQSRKEYLQILESFCNKKISLDEFFNQFYGLRGSKTIDSKWN